MKKILFFILLFSFCLNAYAERPLELMEIYLQRNSASIQNNLENLDFSFQNTSEESGGLDSIWLPTSYLPMKSDSLNRLNNNVQDNLAEKYGYAFNIADVPQKVSFNEGIESAKKYFCSNPAINCDSLPGKTVNGMDSCEKSDDGCGADHFCSYYVDQSPVCIPKSVLLTDLGGVTHLSCEGNESNSDCATKGYYNSVYGCYGPSNAVVDSDAENTKLCILGYAGLCNGQALAPVISPQRPFCSVEVKNNSGMDTSFSPVDVGLYLAFTGNYPFLAEDDWKAVGNFCMSNGSAERDYLGYYIDPRCNDVNPAIFYTALRSTLPIENEVNAKKTGFAANFDHNHIWYKHVTGYNSEIIMNDMTDDEIKGCVAGDSSVNVGCKTPCIPYVDPYNPDDPDPNCEATLVPQQNFMPVRDIESQEFLIAFNAMFIGQADKYYLMETEVSYSSVDVYDANGAVTSNMTVNYILGISQLNDGSYVVTEGYWIGESKYQLQDSEFTTVDTMQWASEIDDVEYAGITGENIKWLYKMSIDGFDNDNLCQINDNCPYHYNPSQTDTDGDGIGDVCDNCPFISNLDQSDSDGDEIGDACDGCGDIPDKLVSVSPFDELISGRYFEIGVNTGGADFLGLGYSSAERIGDNGFTKFVFKWQPDHDLDGIPDACDYVNSEGGANWQGDGFTYSVLKDVKPESFLSPWTFRTNNEYASMKINMPENSGRGLSFCGENQCGAAVHLCAIPYIDRNSWGEAGLCSTSDIEGGTTGFNFGYSHGSDDFTQESVESWQSRITPLSNRQGSVYTAWAEFTGSSDPNMDTARRSVSATYDDSDVLWNWKRDWYEKRECTNPNNSGSLFCQRLRQADEEDDTSTMYYTLSTSVLPVSYGVAVSQIPAYIDNSNGTAINSNYFSSTNANKFSRASRYSKSPMELNYYGIPNDVPDLPETIEIPEIEFCPSCYWDIPIRLTLDETGMPLDDSYKSIGRWMIGKDLDGNYSFSAQRIVLPQSIKLIRDITEHEMIAVEAVENPADGTEQYYITLNTSKSGADWNRIGTVSAWDNEIGGAKAIETTSSGLYFIAQYGDLGDHLFKVTADNVPEGIIDPQNMPQITYSVTDLGETGTDDLFDEMKLISSGDKLYLIGSDSTGGGTRTLKLTENTPLFENVAGTAPAERKIYNLSASNNYIFLTGGMDANNGSMTDIWRFDTETEIWEQIPVTLQGDFRKVITQLVDGKLVMANPVIDGNTTHPAIEIDPDIEDISSVTVDYIEIPVTEYEYDEGDGYCLYNDGTFILGGREQGGTCTPFTVPEYDTFSTGSTVYTLAGSGTKLAVGTGSNVKIYDITDPLNPVLGHTQTVYGPASDILVYENKLIVAVENGVDTIDLETYAYTHTATYGTTKALEIYNGKLYAGDGQGIKVFDPDTLTLISQINTSGDVTQLEIIDGTVHTFEWAGLKRYDAETLTEIQTDTYYVSNPETFVYNSKLYIFRNNSTAELSFNVSTVTETSYVGDEVELRNHYTYGNYTYFPEGTGLRISTIEDDPAPICGNSHLETGEVCDSSSVACTTLDSDYDSGTAYCNSTCDGYNESNCEEDDGW